MLQPDSCCMLTMLLNVKPGESGPCEDVHVSRNTRLSCCCAVLIKPLHLLVCAGLELVPMGFENSFTGSGKSLYSLKSPATTT